MSLAKQKRETPKPVKPKLLFRAETPDLGLFVGKTVTMPSGQVVKIDTIVGNVTKPAFYEINGEHLIGMLRFHAQMIGETGISEAQFHDFEEMVMESVKQKAPDAPKEIKDV